MSMVAANQQGDASALKELLQTLSEAIDECKRDSDWKLLPQLARQYRETRKALMEIEVPTDDGVEALLDGCDAVR